MRIRRYWARRLLYGAGLRIRTDGTPPDFPCLIVGNHRSYLDPIILLCEVNAWPVAKAEISGWPIIGKGAQMAGILYLRREDAKDRAGMLNKIAATIQNGFQVMLFPEGTTSDLPGTLPFKKGGFVLAAKNGIPVVPVALIFSDPDDYWVGDDTFLGHAAKRFKVKHHQIQVCYGPVLQHEEPEVLSEQARTWIEARLLGAVPTVDQVLPS